jgi:hypothetical protein
MRSCFIWMCIYLEQLDRQAAAAAGEVEGKDDAPRNPTRLVSPFLLPAFGPSCGHARSRSW